MTDLGEKFKKGCETINGDFRGNLCELNNVEMELELDFINVTDLTEHWMTQSVNVKDIVPIERGEKIDRGERAATDMVDFRGEDDTVRVTRKGHIVVMHGSD